MKAPAIALCLILQMTGAISAAEPQSAKAQAPEIKDIKAYCLDFNWAATGRKRKPFATPGTWAGADPAQHVAWYKAMGVNVIQTFCVSTNGYAWYKNGFVPQQPGLKHDFLPEVVKLGHQEAMLVFGYFCIASNPVWGTAHPEQSYGTPTTYHIPYTDEYLAYSRKAIDRCWKAIRKAAKDANPNCIVWLTSNQMNHPHVIHSDMYKEADWLMNESGDMGRIDQVKSMVGKHTRLITCLARWNNQDATKVVPEALKAGVGLYGFTVPRNGGGLVPLEEILSRPVSELKGDDRNIAVLARAYHGVSSDAVRNSKGEFVEPVE